jgi:hypothetical protein
MIFYLYANLNRSAILCARGRTFPLNSYQTNCGDYRKALGHMLSEDTCTIYFGPNTNVDTRVEVCTVLSIMMEALSNRYLARATFA